MKYISILLISSLFFAQQTVEYGWEDGGTIIGSYGNLSNPQNVGSTDGVTPYEGDYMLSVSESPVSGTPQAWVAWVTDLSSGDEVTACFYGYDDSPNGSPSLRIWGSWSLNDDINSYSGSADGNTAYTDGSGWSQLCHTFSTTQANWEEGDALIVQARLYSGSDDPSVYFIDKLEVTAPSSATVNIPSLENAIEGCTDANADNYNPDANIDDGTCEYENAQEYTISQLQETSSQSGESDFDCYPSPFFGELITTTGIVTAVRPGSPNFFLQDPNAESWSGIYVFDTSINPTIGSELSITAEVNEYYGATQLLNVGTFELLSSGNSVSSTDIETGQLGLECGDGEMYEGMLVTVSDVEIEFTDEYNAWFINDGSGGAKIDDYFFDGEWSMPVAGDSFESITGVVHFAFGQYAIYPRFANDIQTDSTLPVADAGPDQSVTPGQLVTLDGSNSYDSDGEIVGYEWTAPEGLSIAFDENDVSFSFNAPDDPGQYVFTLRVFDNLGNEDTDQVTVSVLPILSIYDIQYTDIITGEYDDDCYPTPYHGQVVTTSGVVTAVKPGEYPNFYIEDPANDLWSGVYVYDTSINPSVGDEILITAEAKDFFGITELTYVSSFTTLSVGNILQPQLVQTGDLGTACNLSGESFEGMLVSIQNAEVVSIDEFGVWTVNDGSGDAMVDDYFFDGDWPSVSIGDVVNASGVLGYAYGEYKIYPRSQSDFEVGCTANGDVNQDGFLNILDIVVMVNFVVGSGDIDECVADINQDGIVNILDVVTALNLALSERTYNEATNIKLVKGDYVLTTSADGKIPGIELTVAHDPNISIRPTDDCYLSTINTDKGISKIVVLYPNSEIIFTSSGDYEVLDVMAANSIGEIETLIAEDFKISNVFPNPFNPITNIEFNLSESSKVEATIYNIAGDNLEVLVSKDFEAGLNRLEWNASKFPSGVYILQLESDFGVDTRKLVLMK